MCRAPSSTLHTSKKKWRLRGRGAARVIRGNRDAEAGSKAEHRYLRTDTRRHRWLVSQRKADLESTSQCMRINAGQQGGTACERACCWSGNLTSILSTHMLHGENQLLKVTL